MTKALLLALFLATSVAHAADGVLNLGPNTTLQGALTVQVNLAYNNLSDAEELASCKAQYDQAMKSIKAAGMIVLVARECVQTPAQMPDQGFGIGRTTSASIQFTR